MKVGQYPNGIDVVLTHEDYDDRGRQTTSVEIQVSQDNGRIWINVGEICVCRIAPPPGKGLTHRVQSMVPGDDQPLKPDEIESLNPVPGTSETGRVPTEDLPPQGREDS